MASYATVTEGRTLSAKYRGIRIKLQNTETRPEDIVESLLKKCHVDDLETVQPMPGRGNWVIVFTREELVNNCLLGLDINGENVHPQRVAKERYVYASVQYVPPDISNDEIALALSDFTEVKSIKDQYMREYPGIKTGRRLVVLKPHGDLPPFFDVGGVRATLMFKGRIACCPYCDGTDHLGRECPNKKAKKICFHCEKPGHFRRECPERQSTQREPPPPENEQEAAERIAGTDGDVESLGNSTESDSETDIEDMQEDTQTSMKETGPSSDTAAKDSTGLEIDTNFSSTGPSATPLLFSAPAANSDKPSDDKTSPPGTFSFNQLFTLPKSTPVFFQAPSKGNQNGARHHLPPVAPFKPGSKRHSKTPSPRADLRFPTKKADKESVDEASRALDFVAK